MSQLRIVVAEPADIGEIPNVSHLPHSKDFGPGSLVQCKGVLYRRGAAPLGERRGLLRGRVSEDTKPDDRPGGEWSQVTSGYEIRGSGAIFDRLCGGEKTWGGYSSLGRARRDAAELARKHDCVVIEDL